MEGEHIYELPNLKEAFTSQDRNSQSEIPLKCTPVNLSVSATPRRDKSKSKKPVCSWLCMCALVGFILVGSAAFASLALTVLWNSSQVNHQSAKLEMVVMQLQRSLSGLVNGSISEYERRLTQLQNSISGLEISVNCSISELKGSIVQLQNSLNDSTSELERIVQIQNSLNDRIGRDSINPAASCSQILLLNSSSSSGHYWIRSSNGSAVRVYCDFNRQCGCDGPSGWTRVAFLNMSDPNQVCPNNWTTIASPVRTCGRNSSCDSVFYSTFGLTYSRVCGHIIAYQNGNTDAFKGLVHSSHIDQPYVDGVSLTHGSVGSRQHIWSFASALGEEGPFRTWWLCACSNSNNWPHSTSFVGKDYFCDSGNHLKVIPLMFHSNDPLWDGQGCGSNSTCCQLNNPPWFCKTLPESTTDDLEVRICNSGNSDDTPVQLLELYVQ